MDDCMVLYCIILLLIFAYVYEENCIFSFLSIENYFFFLS